jgi:hypothetical protein
LVSHQSAAESDSTTDRVRRWLDDLQLVSEEQHAVVTALRRMVLDLDAGVTEEVKYGGLLFSANKPFCGIYAYTAHVSLAFSKGADLAGPAEELEGAGKYRRHIKLRGIRDLQRCDFAAYLARARDLGTR